MHPDINRYKAIWFDAGDTLVTIRETEKMFAQYLASRALTRSIDEIKQALHAAFNEVYYRHNPDQFEACTPDSDRKFWLHFYRYVLEKLGMWQEVDEERAHKLCHELYELYIAPEYYELFDDVLPVLRQLQERGFHLAVISNFAPTLPQILQAKGVAQYFDPIIVSTLVGFEKPDPRIFTYALEITGYAADDVLYVGDHEVNDVWAPKQAGIHSIRIKRYDYQSGSGISSLHELLNG